MRRPELRSEKFGSGAAPAWPAHSCDFFPSESTPCGVSSARSAPRCASGRSGPTPGYSGHEEAGMNETPQTEMEQLTANCLSAAQFYGKKPGLVGPDAVIDLYRTIAVLARFIEDSILEKKHTRH